MFFAIPTDQEEQAAVGWLKMLGNDLDGDALLQFWVIASVTE
jgi:hypothetical protein